MNTAANRENVSFIKPVVGDLFDRAYQFGKPLTYLSDRQQLRLLILRGRVYATRAAPDAFVAQDSNGA
jgi:hypothetical protein